MWLSGTIGSYLEQSCQYRRVATSAAAPPEQPLLADLGQNQQEIVRADLRVLTLLRVSTYTGGGWWAVAECLLRPPISGSERRRSSDLREEVRRRNCILQVGAENNRYHGRSTVIIQWFECPSLSSMGHHFI